MYSLRRTLSVRFSITMFAALMLIGMGAFLSVRRTLNDLTDQSLVSALELVSDVLARGLSVARHAEPDDSSAFVEGINRFVVVRDAAGQVRLSVNDTSPAPQVIQHRNHAECKGRGRYHPSNHRRRNPLHH